MESFIFNSVRRFKILPSFFVFLFLSASGFAQDLPQILQVFEKNPETIEDVEELIKHHWHEKALRSLNQFPIDDEKVLLLKGKALIGLHRYDEALVVLDHLLQKPPSRKIEKEGLFQKGKALSRQQRYSEAIQVFRQTIEKERRSRKQTRLMWMTFKTALEAKHYKTGISLLEDLRSPQVHWWRGWCHYRLGDDGKALTEWKKISKNSGFYPRAVFWEALIAEKREDKKGAEHNFQLLVQKYPFHYYGYLSLFQLYPEGTKAETVMTETWKAKRNGLDGEFFPEKLPPQDLQTVFKIAEQNHLDPYLVLALIKQESHFRGDAVSGSGAIGLMQIMPRTALRLSQNGNARRFRFEKLLDAKTNISLGTLYLKQLHHLFADNVPYVLAAYNAGEEATSRWLKVLPEETLLHFVEEIPYAQTQEYTQKVLSNYWTYYWLKNQEIPKRMPVTSFKRETPSPTVSCVPTERNDPSCPQ
ncbi:MAG: transglycosylase SLT domain-containing protein, partial [Deltaproteobacteria bacterium]|nr:transglycosylase SLT domain-containing protein [Deltaproteobacteria bacterium]